MKPQTAIDFVQEKFLGQGPQDNESAFEQAKDKQIANCEFSSLCRYFVNSSPSAIPAAGGLSYRVLIMGDGGQSFEVSLAVARRRSKTTVLVL